MVQRFTRDVNELDIQTREGIFRIADFNEF